MTDRDRQHGDTCVVAAVVAAAGVAARISEAFPAAASLSREPNRDGTVRMTALEQ